MEKLLAFGVSDTAYCTIKQIASRMKITCERFSPACCTYTLDQLLTVGSSDALCKDISCTPEAPAAAEQPFCKPKANAESLLVICNLSDKRLDKLLFELRKGDTDLTYKAILTPTNRHFTVSQLFLEMRREKAAYARMQPLFPRNLF